LWAGGPFQIFIPGLDHLPPVKLPDYWIDQHEVTNRDFKRFVDDGGYRRPEFWQEPFVKDGRPVSHEAAMSLFVDTTGKPGPAAWEQGAYPNGQDEYPVAGVSWYEAAAYARWAGKSLPTIFHWSRAADQRLSGNVVPASNFSGKALLPIGRGGQDACRHGGHGRQRQGMVLERRGRSDAVHSRRRVERARVHVHGRRRTIAVRPPDDVWFSPESRPTGRRISNPI
jgi:hypothetical protein